MPGGGDRVVVGVEVTLRGRQGSVAGDLAGVMDRDPRIGHPGQPGVAQVVPAQPFEPQVGDNLVPVRRVAQYGGGDAPTAWPDEEPAVAAVGGEGEPTFDQGADLRDQGNEAGALALGVFYPPTRRVTWSSGGGRSRSSGECQCRRPGGRRPLRCGQR